MTTRAIRLTALTMFGASCIHVTLASAQTAPPTLVDVGGHKLNVRVAGTAKPGVPSVVFESGLGSPLLAWFGVPAEIAASTRVVAYERAGVGASEPGPEPRTVKQIVAELHALLAKIDVLTGQPSFALYADSATTFSLKVVDAQIEFETDAAGGVTGLVLAQNGQRLRALRTK